MSDAGKQAVKAAFEIKTSPLQVMTLSETEVEKYLDPKELLDGLDDGFRGLELGEVQSPPRPQLSVAGKGFCLAMPAWRPGMQLTVKIAQACSSKRNRTRNCRRGSKGIRIPAHSQ